MYVAGLGKPVSNSMRNNHNTKQILNTFENTTNTFKPVGRSGLLKASDILLTNVNTKVLSTVASKSLDYQSRSTLSGYVPYHNDLLFQARLPATQASTSPVVDQPTDEDPYLVEKRFSMSTLSNGLAMHPPRTPGNFPPMFQVKYSTPMSKLNSMELPLQRIREEEEH